MSRRCVAKTNIPAKVRAWVKNFDGKDVYSAYRKHYNVSHACATIELAAMGLPFPVERIEEAKRGQPAAIEAKRAKKAKKAAKNRPDEFACYENVVSLRDYKDFPEMYCFEWLGNYPDDELAPAQREPSQYVIWRPTVEPPDAYDPFAD